MADFCAFIAWPSEAKVYDKRSPVGQLLFFFWGGGNAYNKIIWKQMPLCPVRLGRCGGITHCLPRLLASTADKCIRRREG